MSSKTSKKYIVEDASLEVANTGFSGLKIVEMPIPQCGEYDVLVRIHAVSLNFRDIMVATGTYIWPAKDGVVPCSDGAGEVIDVGSKVRRFAQGDKVAATFFQEANGGTLGADLDGMLQEYAVFHETGLVKLPAHLTMEEASTLPCADVTAWNALMGGGKRLQAGDSVITQGTGGVSMAALQFAVAAGAQVVATTSSEPKAQRLRDMGAFQTINYRDTPAWGPAAKKLLNNGHGADFVIEIGGPETIEQSLKSVNRDGTIAVIGQRTAQAGGKAKNEMTLMEAFMYPCTMRRILVGSRAQFEDMNRAIAVNKIRPVVDEKVFGFEDAPRAFEYLYQQKHFGNVVIRTI
jgi:NADPH:quinone reductase-like Zn-dependent oxidoreductase